MQSFTLHVFPLIKHYQPVVVHCFLFLGALLVCAYTPTCDANMLAHTHLWCVSLSAHCKKKKKKHLRAPAENEAICGESCEVVIPRGADLQCRSVFYANTHTHTHMYKTQIHRDTDACQHNNLFSLKKGGSC